MRSPATGSSRTVCSAQAGHADLIDEHCALFLGAIPPSAHDGVTGRARAETLAFASDALERTVVSRGAYREGGRSAIRVICPHAD